MTSLHLMYIELAFDVKKHNRPTNAQSAGKNYTASTEPGKQSCIAGRSTSTSCDRRPSAIYAGSIGRRRRPANCRSFGPTGQRGLIGPNNRRISAPPDVCGWSNSFSFEKNAPRCRRHLERSGTRCAGLRRRVVGAWPTDRERVVTSLLHETKMAAWWVRLLPADWELMFFGIRFRFRPLMRRRWRNALSRNIVSWRVRIVATVFHDGEKRPRSSASSSCRRDTFVAARAVA